MKKQFITGFISGALIFGIAGALAATYTATDNPFPVKLNGNDVQIEGYNIEGSTYFKLRDIADVVGGFSVDFKNNTIQLAQDGYVYPEISEPSMSPKIYPDMGWIYETEPKTNYLGKDFEYTYSLPQFNIDSEDARALNNEICDIHTDTELMRLSYNSYTNGNILSLVIKSEMVYNDVVVYSAHNIDLSTGKGISNSELVKMAGITEDELLTAVRDVLKQRMDEHLSELPEEFMAQAESLYERGLSEECCNMNRPMYVDEEQNLIVIPLFSTLAGGYSEPLNLGYKVYF